VIAAVERALQALSGAIDRLCSWIAFAALQVMLISILLQVVARYVFSAPPAWTEELGRYAMIWASMAGAAMAYYRGADPVMFRLTTKGMPGRALVMQAVEAVAVLTLAAPVLLYAPSFLARHSHRITETLEWNSAAVVAVIPATFVVILIHLSARCARAIREFNERETVQ
jgi:TRAP-type C4-dicarboxylate transport system permease small subunit